MGFLRRYVHGKFFIWLQATGLWGTLFQTNTHMGMGQNLVPLVNLKIAGKWMFITLKMVLIGIDP